MQEEVKTVVTERCNFIAEDGLPCQQLAKFAVLCSDDPYDISHVCVEHKNVYEHIAAWTLHPEECPDAGVHDADS